MFGGENKECALARMNGISSMGMASRCPKSRVCLNRYGITNWGVVPEPDNVLTVLADFGQLSSVDTNRFYVMGQSESVRGADGSRGDSCGRTFGFKLQVAGCRLQVAHFV